MRLSGEIMFPQWKLQCKSPEAGGVDIGRLEGDEKGETEKIMDSECLRALHVTLMFLL